VKNKEFRERPEVREKAERVLETCCLWYLRAMAAGEKHTTTISIYYIFSLRWHRRQLPEAKAWRGRHKKNLRPSCLSWAEEVINKAYQIWIMLNR